MNLLDLTENPRDLGLLSLGLRLMSTPGKFGTALGQAGMGALQDVQQAQQAMDARKMRGLQQQMLEQQLAAAKAQQEEAARMRQGRMSYVDSIDNAMGPAMPPSLVGAMRAGFSPDEAKTFLPAKPENQFSKVDPKDYTPDSVAIFARTGNYADLVARNKREFVNGQAVDPYTTPPGTVIPPQANPATDLLVLGADGQWKPNVPLVNVRKDIGKASASNVVNVQPDNLGLKPKDRFDMEQKLATDFTAATKTDRGIVSVSQDLSNILKQPGAIKDQAAIYKFAKFLDPDGAVRESDYAAIVRTSGGVDYVKSLFNKALTGEQLSDKQRTEMANLVGSMAAVAQKRLQGARSRFEANARQYNLNPDNVFQLGQEPADISLQDAAAAELARRRGGR